MNKQEMVNLLAKTNHITKAEALRRIDEIFEFIMLHLEADSIVKIRNFGTFKVSVRAEKRFVNPKTNEELVIPETKVPLFTPSEALRNRIADKTIKE